MREHKKLGLALLWFLITSTSGVLSSVLASFFGVYTLGMGLPVLGTTVSFCIACGQILVLRMRLPGVNWSRWLLISTAAGTAGWIVICLSVVLRNIANMVDEAKPTPILHSGYMAPLIISSLCGLVYGAIQVYAFHSNKRYVWWCLANSLGVGSGVVLGLQIADNFMPAKPGMLLGFDDAVRISITSGTATLLMSFFTGLVLAVLPDKNDVENSRLAVGIES